MNKNERIAEFAAKLIADGRNPILAVFDAMSAIDPKPQQGKCAVHCVSHDLRPDSHCRDLVEKE